MMFIWICVGLCTFQVTFGKLTANLTVEIKDEANRTLIFNDTFLPSFANTLCDIGTFKYDFEHHRSSGLFMNHIKSSFSNGPNSTLYQGSNLFEFVNVNNNYGLEKVKEAELCTKGNRSIFLKVNNITECKNECIYFTWSGSIIGMVIDYHETELNSGYINECPALCGGVTHAYTDTKSTNTPTATSNNDKFTNEIIKLTSTSMLSVDIFTDGAKYNTTTGMTSNVEANTATMIIAIVVSVSGAIIVLIIVIVMSIVLRKRNKSKEQPKMKQLQEKNQTKTPDDNYTCNSLYNSSDNNGKETINSMTNKGNSTQSYHNYLFTYTTQDNFLNDKKTNVSSNHIGDVYAVVNKPEKSLQTRKDKPQTQNTPVATMDLNKSDDYSSVNKPGSQKSPKAGSDGHAGEYSTLHQVNKMSEDIYTQHNHANDKIVLDEGREGLANIEIVYLPNSGHTFNEELKRTSMGI